MEHNPLNKTGILESTEILNGKKKKKSDEERGYLESQNTSTQNPYEL